jgi:hypothetical protein
LDPAYSYLVFECDEGAAEGTTLQAITTLLRKASKGVCHLQTSLDSTTEKLLLVAKLEPHRAEMIKDRVLDINLPRNMAVYFYRLDKRNRTHMTEKY